MELKENVHSRKKEINDVFKYKEQVAGRYAAASLALALLCLLLGGACVYFAQKVTIIPYIVQVDEHGYEVAIGPLKANDTADERVVIARLGTFVSNWRSVSSDMKVQKERVDWLYSSIPERSSSLTKINEWFRENDPFKFYYDKKITREADVKSVLKVSDATWRVEWNETDYSLGHRLGQTSWTGLFTVGITPSADMNSVIKNPLGIYVTDYSVSPDFRASASEITK